MMIKNLQLKIKQSSFIVIAFLLLFNVLSISLTHANEKEETIVPDNIILLFPDRTLVLNFQTQPDLLAEKPKYFLYIGEKKIPISSNKKLIKQNKYITLETEFNTVVSPENLHNFFVASSVFQAKESTSIEIHFDKEKDKISFDGKPYDGFEIDEEKLVDLINKAIEIGEKHIRVPARKIFSKVVVHPDLAAQGISEVLAVGKSNFAGSSNARKQNIQAGARRFHTNIIPKGKTFSFNTILGSVDEKYGFVKELVIKGNENKKELGGGLCQVSTTAFRAAFTGGLPIIERRNHSYSVPYYKPFGLDASIYLGVIDFRFKNNTPGSILIQTFIENEDLYFVFYGTRDDRQISFEGPFISKYRAAPATQVFETEDLPDGETKMVSDAHAGFRTEWIRRVSKDGEKEEESLISNYRPWPAKILKGIGKKEEKESIQERIIKKLSS